MIDKLKKATIGTKIFVGARKTPFVVKARNDRYLICIGKRFTDFDHLVFDLDKLEFGVVIPHKKLKHGNNQSNLDSMIKLLEINALYLIKDYVRYIEEVDIKIIFTKVDSNV